MTHDLRRFMNAVQTLVEATDATHNPLPSEPEDANHSHMEPPDYMAGKCHVYAIALHRTYGYRFLVLIDRSERYKGGIPAVHHIYAVDTDGHAYDCRGRHDATEIVAQWRHLEPGQWHRPDVLRIDTERGLRRFISDDWNKPLDSYTEADVQAAMATLQP